MLVGNDIVDLRDPETRLDALHPRFLERVLTAAELARFNESASPQATLWSFWAAKESAYKLLRKLRPGTMFSPRRYAVARDDLQGSGSARGHVTVDDVELDVDLRLDEQWVHACATLPGQVARHAVAPKPAHVSPSAFVRRTARARFACWLGLRPADLEIRGRRPPRLWLRSVPLSVDMSLSHHGRWVAVAASVGA